MTVLASKIFFTAVFLIAFLISRRAEKTGRKIYIYFVIAILGLIAGMRAYSVGIDTNGYSQVFDLIIDGNERYVYQDKGFVVFSKFLLKIVPNPSFAFGAISVITVALIILRLWDFNDVAPFSLSVLGFLLIDYFYLYNIIIQMLVVAIVFWATRFLKSGKYCLYLLLVVLATTIHTSAVVGVVFLYLEVFQWKYCSKLQRFVLILAMVLPLAVLSTALNIFNYYTLIYATHSKFQIGFLQLFILLFSVFAVLHFRRNNSGIDGWPYIEDEKNRKYKIKNVCLSHFVGIALICVGYIFPYAGRIGLYFQMFEPIFFAMLMNSKRSRQFMQFGVLILYLALIIVEVLSPSGGQGQYPYAFFWQHNI